MDKGKKQRKPLRRAQRWGRQVPMMALKLAGLMVAIVVAGLIFSALQAIDSAWLRIGLSALLTAGVLVICMNEGVTKGAVDAAASRGYDSMVSRGLSVSEKEDEACYHPLKALCAVLIVFIVPLALSVYVALTAENYSYTLQDLPTWVTESYGVRADVMGPLGAYGQAVAIETQDWLRMLVRLPMMMFINLFADPLMMSGLIDRVSPLCIAAYPLVYVIGYLCGPSLNRRREKDNRRAKKLAARKAQKKGLAAELTGSQMQVHYGHKAESGKHKKKELV